MHGTGNQASDGGSYEGKADPKGSRAARWRYHLLPKSIWHETRCSRRQRVSWHCIIVSEQHGWRSAVSRVERISSVLCLVLAMQTIISVRFQILTDPYPVPPIGLKMHHCSMTTCFTERLSIFGRIPKHQVLNMRVWMLRWAQNSHMIKSLQEWGRNSASSRHTCGSILSTPLPVIPKHQSSGL